MSLVEVLEELLEMLESSDEEERWLAKELLDDLEEDLFFERNMRW